MKIKTGIDIIKISRLQTSINRVGESFVKRVFFTHEYQNKKIDTIAGIYAAKEAIIKALDLPADSWLNIEIKHEDTGKPYFIIKNISHKIESADLSIAHDEGYAVASVVIIMR
jgi:holo-[acyl-carrier-protein] synthase